MLIYRKRRELARKKCHMAFVDIDFLPSSVAISEISTELLLIYFFKVNISNVNISDTVRG